MAAKRTVQTRVKRLQAEVRFLTNRLSATKRKVKVKIDGPNAVDDVAVEGWSLPVSGSKGKFTAEDEVFLTPKQIVLDLTVTGQKGTKVDVKLTINGVTKPRDFKMAGDQHSKVFHYKFSDFNLPT